MVRFAGSVCIAMGVGLACFRRAGRVRKQFEEMLYFKKMILLLRGEIEYTQAQVGEIFLRLSMHARDPYAEWFETLAEQLELHQGESFFEKWEENLVVPLEQVIGKGRELDRLRELGENLGYLNKEMQIHAINYFLEQFEESMEERREKVRYQEKMYRSLGVLGGIFIVLCFW